MENFVNGLMNVLETKDTEIEKIILSIVNKYVVVENDMAIKKPLIDFNKVSTKTMPSLNGLHLRLKMSTLLTCLFSTYISKSGNLILTISDDHVAKLNNKSKKIVDKLIEEGGVDKLIYSIERLQPIVAVIDLTLEDLITLPGANLYQANSLAKIINYHYEDLYRTLGPEDSKMMTDRILQLSTVFDRSSNPYVMTSYDSLDKTELRNLSTIDKAFGLAEKIVEAIDISRDEPSDKLKMIYSISMELFKDIDKLL